MLLLIFFGGYSSDVPFCYCCLSNEMKEFVIGDLAIYEIIGIKSLQKLGWALKQILLIFQILKNTKFGFEKNVYYVTCLCVVFEKILYFVTHFHKKKVFN